MLMASRHEVASVPESSVCIFGSAGLDLSGVLSAKHPGLYTASTTRANSLCCQLSKSPIAAGLIFLSLELSSFSNSLA
jgi:hypothetical protein